MLLHRAPGTRTLSKPDWRARIQALQQGEWLTLLTSSARHSSPSPTAPVPPTAQNPTAAPSDRRRRERARHLVHTGELSAARQALTAGPLAPGTLSTLARLRDPDRRPATAYCTENTHPPATPAAPPLHLATDKLVTALRKTRKGAAAGPSGLTPDTLRIVLDDEETTARFAEVCNLLATASVPPQIVPAIGLGRMVALQKPQGGVRGLVVGDLLRRVVSRTLAQTFSTLPHSMQPFPVRFVHQGRHRSSCPFCISNHRATPNQNHPIHRRHRSIRQHLESQHAKWLGSRPGSPRVPSFCPNVVRPAFGIRLA